MIIVIWVPAGYDKPYRATSDLSKGQSQRLVYIKRLSNTVPANSDEERELVELSPRIPFIDRRNNSATLKNFDRGLITDYLEK